MPNSSRRAVALLVSFVEVKYAMIDLCLHKSISVAKLAAMHVVAYSQLLCLPRGKKLAHGGH